MTIEIRFTNHTFADNAYIEKIAQVADHFTFERCKFGDGCIIPASSYIEESEIGSDCTAIDCYVSHSTVHESTVYKKIKLGLSEISYNSTYKYCEIIRDEVKKKTAIEIVNEQAEDEGLWFVTQTATEDYLQRALRRLHEAIENNEQTTKKEAL